MLNKMLCLQTKSGGEYKLAEMLNRLEIEAYAPRYKKTVVSTYDVVTTYELPFFRTYLFASLEYHARKSAVNLLPVSLRSWVVGELDYSHIEEIKAHEENGFVIMVTEKARRFGELTDGELVKVTDGRSSFYGLQGVFDASRSDDERTTIFLTLFNQPTPVHLKRNQIESVYAY
jgi:transcription antitermination factor NusG